MALASLAKRIDSPSRAFEWRKMPTQQCILLVSYQPVFQLLSQVRHGALQQHAFAVDGLEQVLLATKVTCGRICRRGSAVHPVDAQCIASGADPIFFLTRNRY